LPIFDQVEQLQKQGLEEGVMDQTGASWNRVVVWMRQLESLRRVS
jgi:hypothetical protein